MKKRKRRNAKRFIAVCLVLALMISLLPVDVLAKTSEEESGNRVATADPEETLLNDQTEKAVPFNEKDINKEEKSPQKERKTQSFIMKGTVFINRKYTLILFIQRKHGMQTGRRFLLN